jgi:hypothetical protein
MSSQGIGLLFLAPSIGGLLAAVLAAFVNDPLAEWCTRRSHGIFEPEFRLFLGIFGLVMVGGFVAWGYTAQNGYSIFLSSSNLGLLMFGIGNVLISSMNYLIDGYRGMANDALLASMATKNIFSFGYSYFINDWVARDGLYKVCWDSGGRCGRNLDHIPDHLLLWQKV